MLTQAERRTRLEQASFNVIRLRPADIEHDYLTDVPGRPWVAEVRDLVPPLDDEPDLAGAASRLYGPARYVFAMKGRAAERALAHAVAAAGKVVLSCGPFRTTEVAWTESGARVEDVPIAARGGSAPDLEALARRLAAGDVAAVALEACNNTYAGWPLRLEAVARARDLCRAAGAALVLDATRILANARLLGLPAAAAREMIASCDAFTVSCSKEALVPIGALVGVRTPELENRVFRYCFDQGSLLEPRDTRARLAFGLELMAARGDDLLTARARQLDRLARGLAARGIPVLEPIGGHALFLPLAPALGEIDRLRAIALEGWLYVLGGVRAHIAAGSPLGEPVMRLAATLGRDADRDVDAVADAVRRLFDTADAAPALRAVSDPFHIRLGRYELLGEAT